MSKTTPTFKETKFWILSTKEIEWLIFDNFIQTKSFLLRNYERLEFSIDTFSKIHFLLSWNLFSESWKYRLHNVVLWKFVPVHYFKVPIEMKILEEDMKIRLRNLNTQEEKKEFLAHFMWKLLWVHPFFDYNWRATRLLWELFLLKENMYLTNFQNTSRDDFVNAMKKATDIWAFEDIIALI